VFSKNLEMGRIFSFGAKMKQLFIVKKFLAQKKSKTCLKTK